MSGINVCQIAFWVSIALVLWAYIGYFVCMWIIAKLRPKAIESGEWYPAVSLIVTARDEERRIVRKIDNCLEQRYPSDGLEIIVVSDGSTDSTDNLVKSYSDRGIKLLSIPGRHGKHYAQLQGVLAAKHDLIVLSDATTFLDEDAVVRIVQKFRDPTVGCVSGRDRAEGSGGEVVGEGIYVKYEMILRRFESCAGSIVGASGSFFAVRKYLCDEWFTDKSSDFFLPIISRMRGYRAVADENAVGRYRVVKDSAREFGRKVRTVVHGLDVLFTLRQALNPFKYGMLAFQLISHKLCRWLVPAGLGLALATNIVLFGESLFFQCMLVAQALFYCGAIVGYYLAIAQRSSIVRLAVFFLIVNISIAVAWYEYLRGERYVTWEATKR